ncbi:hypothetical protein MLD38_009336 [Melastoma candidum]|uniref:Uncharacterized protein n=1 Tax=Melastoma candidum TaxID=119954 RepID=A0ACB9RWN2_9MYRT|nr:hypothetical protein MLD38_009336 [Melastoma candidum]
MENVVVGLPGPWANDSRELSDHYTAKIGGLPDWPFPVEEAWSTDLLKCRLCGNRLCLVAQVPAPITSDTVKIKERVLYIFGCMMAKCGISHLSWRAVRIQKLCKGEEVDSTSQSGLHPTASSVSGKEKDWWVDSDEENDEEGDTFSFQELGRALSEAANLASQPRKSKSQKLPDASGKSLVSSNKPQKRDELTPVLPCFYTYDVEDTVTTSRDVASVPSKLPSPSISEDQVEVDDNGQEVALDKEQYEYDKALTADRTYLKFKRRLDVNPEQCYRYSFGGKPLLADTEIAVPSSCGLCGKPRQFEMQLMSPLLYFLHEASEDAQREALDNWNWITLLLYTCSESCYKLGNEESRKDDWILAEETVLLQDEKPLEGPVQLSFFF